MALSRDSRLRAMDAVTDTMLLSTGLGLAVIGLVVLVVRASSTGDAWAIVNVSIFGVVWGLAVLSIIRI